MESDKRPDEAVVRRTAYFIGKVQGVGFRYTAHTLASNFAVTGHVRNLSDGRVELIAEGTPSELSRLLEAIHQAMAGNIVCADVADSEPTGEYPDFRIAV